MWQCQKSRWFCSLFLKHFYTALTEVSDWRARNIPDTAGAQCCRTQLESEGGTEIQKTLSASIDVTVSEILMISAAFLQVSLHCTEWRELWKRPQYLWHSSHTMLQNPVRERGRERNPTHEPFLPQLMWQCQKSRWFSGLCLKCLRTALTEASNRRAHTASGTVGAPCRRTPFERKWELY